MCVCARTLLCTCVHAEVVYEEYKREGETHRRFSLAVSSCSESTFESRENTTTNASILCSAVYVSDVMNTAGMCGKNINYDCHKPDFICSSLVMTEPRWLRLEELTSHLFSPRCELCLVFLYSTARSGLFRRDLNLCMVLSA